MKYFDFVRSFGAEALIKGRTYPSYLIEYLTSYEEPKQYVHEFHVEDKNEWDEYEVIIKNNGDEIYEGTCTCDKFRKYKSCEHVIACLYEYYYPIIRCEIKDLYEETSEILNIFYNPNPQKSVKEKASLQLNITFYDNKIQYRLSIGTNKLYVLNNKSKFDKFLDAYFNGGDDVLGTKFTYNKDNYYFDEEDTKIINYLANYEKASNYYYSIDPFDLSERDLDYLIHNVDVSKLQINREKIAKIIEELPTKFILKHEKKDFSLTIEDLENYNILTNNCKYILYKHILYIIPENYQKLLKELSTRQINTLLFKNQNIEKFNKGILKVINDKLEIASDITEITKITKPNIKIYLDILKDKLTSEIKLNYSGTEINLLSNDSKISRDYDVEEEVMQDIINAGFIINKNKFEMNDIDTIGYFLENNLTNLGNKYEVYTSKKLDKINLIKKTRITKDFSIGYDGIMSFNFELDNINDEELKGILASLKSKKTYHRLKNGNLINLEENKELQEFGSLVDDLELDPSTLNDKIEIPKYRALYIDSLKENKYHDIKTNSLFNDFIANFNKYKDVNINFSKEDQKTLRDYQKTGVKWLYTLYKCDLGGILADEMGLGKSIQAICFIKEVLKEKKDAKILIVCPTSLVYNWEKEFAKFGQEIKVRVISDSKKKRIEALHDENSSVFITSYGLLRNDLEEYNDMNFEICIVDEAQYMKNYQARMTIALKSLHAHTKIALTGTPLENSVTELWSIFDFLMPGYLNSVEKFREKYHISDVTEEDLNRLASLNYQIKPFILRRKKQDVVKDLPDKIENNIYLDLPEKQKQLYVSVLKETEKEIEELIATSGFASSRFKILQLLTKLRQICINPHVLYENYEGESIKTEKIIEMIKDYVKEHHKILIFSSFKRILDLLKQDLEKAKISFYSIDGSTKSKDRLPLIDKFNSDNTSCFLLTLKSGGTGLNLTSADIVIHLDIWWNPQVENQATDRAHRIGQKRKVMVNKLITKGTIEERILELQTKKKILSENLIEGNAEASLAALNEEDIRALLTYSND